MTTLRDRADIACAGRVPSSGTAPLQTSGGIPSLRYLGCQVRRQRLSTHGAVREGWQVPTYNRRSMP